MAGGARVAGGQGEPLGPFIAQRVSVLPVQLLRADSTAPLRAPGWPAARRELDDSIGAAMAERGVGRRWAYAADIDRLAKRNTGYVSDPYALGAAALRNRTFKPGEQAPALVIGNLRSLIALGDSRFALVPVELSFAGTGADRMAVLRLFLLDGRIGQVIWFGDVAAPAATTFGSAEAGVLGRAVADLVARP